VKFNEGHRKGRVNGCRERSRDRLRSVVSVLVILWGRKGLNVKQTKVFACLIELRDSVEFLFMSFYCRKCIVNKIAILLGLHTVTPWQLNKERQIPHSTRANSICTVYKSLV